MVTITADPPTAAQLSGSGVVAEIRDAEGKVLGMFVPGTPDAVRLLMHAWLTLDPAEVRRQKARPEPSYAYAEVKARIGMGDAR